MKSGDVVSGRPEYPAEEEEKAEIVEECENVASDCDDVSHLVCFSFETLLLRLCLTLRIFIPSPQPASSWSMFSSDSISCAFYRVHKVLPEPHGPIGRRSSPFP